MSGLSLVTRGWIGKLERPEIIPLISCDEPQVRQALEARPSMRAVNTPPTEIQAPKIISSTEQKPNTEVEAD